jgi:hypothetical protein
MLVILSSPSRKATIGGANILGKQYISGRHGTPVRTSCQRLHSTPLLLGPMYGEGLWLHVKLSVTRYCSSRKLTVPSSLLEPVFVASFSVS